MIQTKTIPLPEKLYPILASNHRYIDIYGGRGSGKSWAVAIHLLVAGMKQKKRILCTREIQRTIRDSVHKLLSDKIYEHGLDGFYTIKNDNIIGRNGTEFIFKGIKNNPDDVKSMEGIDLAWTEEAQSISRKSLDVLIPTIRNVGSQIIFTYNPTNETDPVHVDFTLSDRPDILKIEINHDQNPFFPDVLRAEMEWDRTHDIDKYYHIWMGQCVKHSEAQVFYGKWIIDDFEDKTQEFYYFGADWGFSKDPTTLIRCFVIDKKLYIDYEYYGIGIDIDVVSVAFRSVPLADKYPIIADSARPETINYVRRNGFPLIQSSIKGKGSVEDGIAHLRGFEKIIIHSRCIHTIDEFRTYCYKVDARTGLVSTILEDKNNHIIDSIRYALEPLMRKRQGAIGRTRGW